jgi:hypothetical protein
MAPGDVMYDNIHGPGEEVDLPAGSAGYGLSNYIAGVEGDFPADNAVIGHLQLLPAEHELLRDPLIGHIQEYTMLTMVAVLHIAWDECSGHLRGGVGVSG